VRLAELPDGAVVFLDANVLAYHYTGLVGPLHDAASNFLVNIRRRRIRAYTSVIVVAEQREGAGPGTKGCTRQRGDAVFIQCQRAVTIQDEIGISKQVWLSGPSSKTLKRRRKARPIRKRVFRGNV